jgi:Cdc6-like AAA superfamily ATPase
VAIDAWLPVGYGLPDGAFLRRALHGGVNWQLFALDGGGHALVVREPLAARWVAAHLIDAGALTTFTFGGGRFRELSSGPTHTLAPVAAARSPQTKSEALAFADAMRATREIDPHSSLHDAVYVERLSRLLPTYSLTAPIGDDVVLGTWLTGGVPVSVGASRRLRSLVGWMGEQHLVEVVARAGFSPPAAVAQTEQPGELAAAGPGLEVLPAGRFTLVGRPQLEAFFNEFIVDIVMRREQYGRLGIDFPGPIVLHGPPGCGKTFAVDRLVDFLGWPSFAIDATSIASPYIHETSRKIAEIFSRAKEHAPAVVVIDEMEAFLADRELGAAASHHRVEEVAEFLRWIPEARQHQVLVIAMTNRIEMIDPGLLRRGRFDHVVRVDMASEDEVRALLEKQIGELPHESTVNVTTAATRLAGRPLSDVAFVVREAARLAARLGKTAVDDVSFQAAVERALAARVDGPRRTIGFQVGQS